MFFRDTGVPVLIYRFLEGGNEGKREVRVIKKIGENGSSGCSMRGSPFRAFVSVADSWAIQVEKVLVEVMT
jgi:hypothetical protein